MELLKKDKEWFLSEEGTNQFCALSLEDRSVFIYSYLKSFVNECFNNVLFRISFFMADAVFESNVEYAKTPKLLDAQFNPFVYFLSRAKFCPDNEVLFVIFSSILHNKVDTKNHKEWIYDKEMLGSEDFLERVSDLNVEFLPSGDFDMVDPDFYEMNSKLSFLQLELIWMFLK